MGQTLHTPKTITDTAIKPPVTKEKPGILAPLAIQFIETEEKIEIYAKQISTDEKTALAELEELKKELKDIEAKERMPKVFLEDHLREEKLKKQLAEDKESKDKTPPKIEPPKDKSKDKTLLKN